jgi:hypothetical protein
LIKKPFVHEKHERHEKKQKQKDKKYLVPTRCGLFNAARGNEKTRKKFSAFFRAFRAFRGQKNSWTKIFLVDNSILRSNNGR